jgi:hypothetical protein
MPDCKLCNYYLDCLGVKLSAEEAERAHPLRLLHKLTERGHEKLLRCADLYGMWTRVTFEAVSVYLCASKLMYF